MTAFDMPPHGTWEQRGGWVVRRLVADLGLSLAQAAGIVGNAGYESLGFTKLQEMRPAVAGSRGGAGWIMWTARRRVAFEAWCVAHHLPAASDEGNFGFLIEELRGAYKSFTARLRLTTNIEDACRLTHREYETPQDVLDGSYRSGPERLKWARRALAGAQESGETAVLDDAIENAVKLLQAFLTTRGLYPDRPGWIDGDPGPETQKAIIAWRASR